MPPIPRRSSKVKDYEDYPGLKPYIHHGMDLDIRGGHGVGECPFCGKEKFSVDCDSGLWRCWVCGGGTENGGSNAITFLRLLHKLSTDRTNDVFLEMVAKDRRLCYSSTVSAWGVCQSVITGEWLVPGYGTDGKLDQLYRRVHILDKGRWIWLLLPTPGIWPEGKVHALHMAKTNSGKIHENVVICEGPWDGMALWESAQDLLRGTTIMATPGCNVWRDEWSVMCRGKNVTLMYDSDYPIVNGNHIARAGYDGMVRVTKKLRGSAKSIRWLKWGEEGYDESLPDGTDVRDILSGPHKIPFHMVDRKVALNSLTARIHDAPPEWFSNGKHVSNGSTATYSESDVKPEYCSDWKTCEVAWQEALEWREELSQVMSVMLAVAASTNQAGDNQLFLQVIGDPGSAKTRLCKGLLVSRYCKLLLHLRSFHSGYRPPGGADEDCSLVARINGLCLITPEADALQNGMNLDQINSQVRQIFDGESGNTYGNSNVDRHYKGLRCPWIQAGTPALMDKDQSRLGDRFLRIRLEQPSEESQQAILLRALDNELEAMANTSDGTSSSIISPKMVKAYALTGGYVDWLRENVSGIVGGVSISHEAKMMCTQLAILTANMRARPNMDPRKLETYPTKELPTRLTSQFGRLAKHLAVVLNKSEVDIEVMSIVRKVALDTAYGHSLNITQWLCSVDPATRHDICYDGPQFYQHTGGISEKLLAMWCNMTPDRMANYLMFLRKIGVLDLKHAPTTGSRWVLTDKMYQLYLEVMSW